MKILIFHTFNQGFLSKFFFSISAKLVEDGHEVLNFSFKSSSQNFNKNGVDIIIKRKGGYWSNYLEIFKIIRIQKPDIIISNFLYTNPALLFGNILGVSKNITWFHSLISQTGASSLNIKIKQIFLKFADIIFANSHNTKTELVHRYNLNSSKINTIPFWTNITKEDSGNRFHITDKHITKFKIGCPGRFSPDKNQQLLIEAISKLNIDERENFHLYMVGRGVDRPELNKIVEQYNLECNINFIDFLDPKSMKSFYKSMDLVVLPSLSEAFGLVFIEAISLGVPVLVSTSFGALNFLNMDSKELEVFTFNPTSSEELLNKIKNFQSNTLLSASYFQNLYIENFDEISIYENFKKIIFDKM